RIEVVEPQPFVVTARECKVRRRKASWSAARLLDGLERIENAESLSIEIGAAKTLRRREKNVLDRRRFEVGVRFDHLRDDRRDARGCERRPVDVLVRRSDDLLVAYSGFDGSSNACGLAIGGRGIEASSLCKLSGERDQLVRCGRGEPHQRLGLRGLGRALKD